MVQLPEPVRVVQLMIHGVPASDVRPIWPQVAPMLKRALDRGLGEWLTDDILWAILERDMQLWVSDKLDAACVTQILNYPRRRICDLLLIGGDGLVDWINVKTIEDWAKAEGCHLLRGFGRRGWSRAAAKQGWHENGCIMFKELKS